MLNLKRLYIFTGKGGVGKTTCAFSFSKYLKENNINVEYAYIANNSISKNNEQAPEINIPGLKILPLNLNKAVKEYVQMKLKSEIVSSLVVKAPFFKSLVSMIPGFNYLIFLGKIIYRLKENPNLHIILDSPSSGHALTMLKVVENFSDIFKTGALFEDIVKMKSFLFNQDNLKINIISLPTELSKNEAIELKDEILKINSKLQSQIFFNNITPKSFLKSESTPKSLRLKIENEQSLLLDIDAKKLIPNCPRSLKEDLTSDISPFTQNLV